MPGTRPSDSERLTCGFPERMSSASRRSMEAGTSMLGRSTRVPVTVTASPAVWASACPMADSANTIAAMRHWDFEVLKGFPSPGNVNHLAYYSPVALVFRAYLHREEIHRATYTHLDGCPGRVFFGDGAEQSCRRAAAVLA